MGRAGGALANKITNLLMSLAIGQTSSLKIGRRLADPVSHRRCTWLPQHDGEVDEGGEMALFSRLEKPKYSYIPSHKPVTMMYELAGVAVSLSIATSAASCPAAASSTKSTRKPDWAWHV
jgi:hypothetical protein